MIREAINWILSKLSPYRQPSIVGMMLVSQNVIIEKPRSAFDLTTGGRK